ncbi:hypothetical protein U1Q18_036057 [Sarracenia purpurea var. burkii]
MTGITQMKSVVGHVMDTQVSWEAAGKPPPSSRASNDFLIKKEGPVKGTRVEVINGGRVPHEPALPLPPRKESEVTSDATGWKAHIQPSELVRDATRPNNSSINCKDESESEAVVLPLQDRIKELENHAVKMKSDSNNAGVTDPVSVRKPSSDKPQQAEIAAPIKSADIIVTLKSDAHKAAAPKSAVKPSVQKIPAPVASMVQTKPSIAHSLSAAERLGPDTSPASHSFVPPSYRNAIMGTSSSASSTSFTQPHSPCLTQFYTQLPELVSAPMILPQISERMEPNLQLSLSFGMNGPHHWVEGPQRESIRTMHYESSSSLHGRSQDHFPTEFSACMSGLQTHGVLADDFPHLDIINDLLDDEHGIAKVAAWESISFQSSSNGPHHLSRLFFPGDIGGHFDSLPDMILQGNTWPYVNGQIDGLIPNQWQVGGSDLSSLSMRNTEGGGYPYGVPEFSNLACIATGYSAFRPLNGY